VLFIRSLCFLLTTVCAAADSVVDQVALLPSNNGLRHSEQYLLYVRLLCSLPILIVYTVVSQVALLPSYNSETTVSSLLSWLGKLAKSLFIFLFFSYLQLQDGAQESIMWLCHNVTMVWQRVTYGHITVTVTVGHMTSVTWGPWESKCIAIVVKCISSREMSKNSIEFSLSNSEQRDSWLNSSHRTLDADTRTRFHTLSTIYLRSCSILLSS